MTASPTSPRLIPVALTVSGFFALWILWVLVLLQFPDAFNGDGVGKGALRAIIRLALWLGPVMLYARFAEHRSLFQFMALGEHWRKGLVGGAVLCGITVVLSVLRIAFEGAEFQNLASIGPGTWLNPILTAPFVEEVVFRGLVFRTLNERIGAIAAIIISSVLFALIHLPYWYLSGAHTGIDLITQLGNIFLIGAVLGVSMRATGSLLTPLIGHWVNNLASIVLK